MPLEPKLLVTAPNGFAIYAFAEDAVFEIDPFANTIGPEISTGLPAPAAVGFDPDGPLDTAFLQLPQSIVLYDMPSAGIGQVLFHGEQCRQSGVARTRPDLCLDRIQRRPFQDRYQRVDSVSGR